MANTEDAYGFPPFAVLERAITLRSKNLHKGKKRDIATLRALERGILEEFLGNMRVTRVISPNFGWADVIPQRVLEGMKADQARSAETLVVSPTDPDPSSAVHTDAPVADLDESVSTRSSRL